MVVRTYSTPASESDHSTLASSSPTRLTTASMPQAKPGSTKPVLRPEAFQAIACASITTTDQPRRATSRATVSPARPPPITQTSTSISLVTAARSGADTAVSVYQVDAAAGPLLELTL